MSIFMGGYPICTLDVIYQNGAHQTGLAPHDTWTQGPSWTWSWKVPTDPAVVGTAQYESVCDWDGDIHGSSVWYTFTVTAS